MDSLLDALQEGRLIELPESGQEQALRLLAHILEAIPSVPTGTDVVSLVMERERVTSTALGKGWACPHARVTFDDDLICALGWSPSGVDYHAPDGQAVSMIAMYLVPSNQRNHYLREVSLLAKALTVYADPAKLQSVTDLNGARNYLLDLIATTKDTVGPDARARMIQLKGKEVLLPEAIQDLANLVIEPVTVIAVPGQRPLVLCQAQSLVDALEGLPNLLERIDAEGGLVSNGWKVVRRGVTAYRGGRTAFDCLAIRSSGSK